MKKERFIRTVPNIKRRVTPLILPKPVEKPVTEPVKVPLTKPVKNEK